MRVKYLVWCALGLGVVASGCLNQADQSSLSVPRAPAPDEFGPASLPETSPLVAEVLREYPSSLIHTNPFAISKKSSVTKADLPDKPPQELTLRRALALALLRNPSLAAASWEIRAGEARKLQASLIPNPEIEVEVEEFGGKGEARRFKVAETTIVLSQIIELGGKRSKRIRHAALERDLLAWDYEAQRLDVLAQVNQAFVDVLAAQERLALAQEMNALAEKFTDTVAKRVEAGKVPPLENTKANVFLSTRRIELKRAKGELRTARKHLSATWGSVEPMFEKALGDLTRITSIPPLKQLVARISRNPDLARWAVEMAQRRAALKLEKAARIPDVALTGGIRHANETDEKSYVMGLSIPFPLFDRNQGAVREAQHNLAKAKEERRAVAVQLRSELAEAHQALDTAHMEAESLKKEVLPLAEKAFAAAKTGYAQGKFEYLDVLDAQRTLMETKEQYIEALAAYHKAVADVERLIGEPLAAISARAKAELKKVEAERKLTKAKESYEKAPADYNNRASDLE